MARTRPESDDLFPTAVPRASAPGRGVGRRLRLASLLVAGVGGLWAGTASAATITPTTTADDAKTNGNCTLREAVQAANTDWARDACPAGAGADTIPLTGGTYTLTLVRPATKAASNLLGGIDVRSDVTIVGAGQAATTIVGTRDQDAGVHVHAGAAATLSGLTVTGAGGSGLRNDGRATLTDVGIARNTAPDGSELPAGIDNAGTLTASDSSVRENNGARGAGGARNSGTMQLTRTSFDGNTTRSSADDDGGTVAALDNRPGGVVTLTGGVVRANRACVGCSAFQTRDGHEVVANAGSLTMVAVSFTGNGRGLLNTGTLRVADSSFTGNTYSWSRLIGNAGDATITNTTIALNQSFPSDVVANLGTLTIRSSTIAGNRFPLFGSSHGFAVANYAGTLRIANTIVSDNLDEVGAPANCETTITSLGYNLIDDPTGCTIEGTGTGDRLGVAPLLGALADNGGPTPTMAPLPGSPAVDAGNPAAAGSSDAACPATDQRGRPRPQDGDANGTAVCDIGAVEVDGPPVPPTGGGPVVVGGGPTGGDPPTPPPTGGSAGQGGQAVPGSTSSRRVATRLARVTVARKARRVVVLTARVTAAGRAVAGRCDLQQRTSRGWKRRATSRTAGNGACVLRIRFAAGGPKTLRIRFLPASRIYAPSLSRVTVVRPRA